MKNRIGIILLIIISLLLIITVSAVDENGNTDNLCDPGQSHEGRCETEWDFEAGWYLYQVQEDLMSCEQIPKRYQSLCTPPPATNTGEPDEPVLTPQQICEAAGGTWDPDAVGEECFIPGGGGPQ